MINPDPASVTFVLTSEPPLKVAVAVAVLIPRLSAVVRPAPNGSVMLKLNVPSAYPDPAFVIVNPVKDPEDILAVTVDDLLIIGIGGPLILLILKLIWKSLFASTVNYELAEAEGLKPDKAKAIFTILMAGVIAISIKMVGLLLITGMLIIPAAMARNVSSSPQSMVIYSILGGLLSVMLGLFVSLEFNTSSGPSIIAAALFLFILSLLKIKQSIKLKN